jgi:hypothetical protein
MQMSAIEASNIFRATSASGSSMLPPFLPPDDPNRNDVDTNTNLTNMNIAHPTNMNLDFNFEDVNSFDLSTSGLGNTYYGHNDFNFNFGNARNPPSTPSPSPEVAFNNAVTLYIRNDPILSQYTHQYPAPLFTIDRTTRSTSPTSPTKIGWWKAKRPDMWPILAVSKDVSRLKSFGCGLYQPSTASELWNPSLYSWLESGRTGGTRTYPSSGTSVRLLVHYFT